MSELLTVSLDPSKKKEAKIVKLLNPVVERVNASLVRLHWLKSHRLMKYWMYRSEYAQRDVQSKTADWYTNYHMNTWFAIVNSKAADILTNTPKFDFVALDDEAKRYKRLRELHWQYVWATSRTDAEVVKIIQDALKYWVWFGEESIMCKKRTVKQPKEDSEGTITYTKEEITEYEGCKLTHIPWAQTYLNWSNIENTTEAIIISYWDRDEFLLTFGNDPQYSWVSDANIPKGKYYYIGQWTDSLTIDWNWASTSRADNTIETSNIVSVLTAYNKYRDEHMVLANNVWINPLNWDATNTSQDNIQPIHYSHKEIPIVVYTDHVVDDDIYGMGEYDISEKSRLLRDDVRSLHIEWIKAQWGIITIDPDSDYDEAIMKLGTRQVARVEKDSFGFFAPNVNLQSLSQLEQKVEEDLIVETWVDFKAQLFGPNETAARTEGRIAASKKRINHNIKLNAFSFYERLARLRSANINVFYADKQQVLPVKGVEVYPDGEMEYIQNWYGLFTMKPEYFKGKIALIPIIDSLVWDTSNEKKQKYLETAQLLLNMRNDKGGPEFPPRTIVEAWRWIIDEVIDIDKLMGKTADTKSPDELMTEAGIGSPSQAPQEPATEGIPAAQRSGAPILLGSSPNQ